MLRRKFAIVFLLVSSLLLSISKPTYAYNLEGYHWSSSAIKYYYEDYDSSRFRYFIELGAAAWNSQSINASLTNSYGLGVFCGESYSPSAGWDGICYISWDNNGYITSASLVLNSGIAQTWNNDGALKSVAVHEFGHILSLGENPGLVCIMNDATWGPQSRYGTYGLTTPQPIDVGGVNYIY